MRQHHHTTSRHPLWALVQVCGLGLLVGLCACGVEVEGPEPPLDAFVSPVGIALHPNARYLYVVNSNFDVAFREDRGGTVTVVDTDLLKIIPSGTVQIGTFGGDIKINQPREGEPTRAYVAVRGNKSVTALDIEDDGARLSCEGRSLSESCQIRLQDDDPFGLVVSSFTFDVPGAGETEVDFVAVAHLLGGNVTGFTVKSGALETARPISAPLVSGANAIAQSPRNGQFYATNRFAGAVVAFRPSLDLEGDVIAIFQTGVVPIENARPYNGLDSRSIVFNRAGDRAYVTNRGPNSLLVLDVGPSDLDTNTGTRNRVVDLIPMPLDPADLALIEFEDRELLYVASYRDKVVLVVDPQTHSIIDLIDVPAEPYDLAVDQRRHHRLYVSLFATNAIGIIDIDPTSPSFNQMTSIIQ